MMLRFPEGIQSIDDGEKNWRSLNFIHCSFIPTLLRALAM